MSKLPVGSGVYFTMNGVTKNAIEWSAETGIPVKAILQRKGAQWSDEKALTTPYHPGRGGCNREVKKYEYDGRSLSLTEWSNETGVKYELLHNRLRSGWTIAEAIETPVGKLPERLARQRTKKKCKNPCIGCTHYAPLNECNPGGQMFCSYSIDMKRLRPCPAGEGCTVREEGERPKPKPRPIRIWNEVSFYYLMQEEYRRIACL